MIKMIIFIYSLYGEIPVNGKNYNIAKNKKKKYYV
jgi:hypothetical protein